MKEGEEMQNINELFKCNNNGSYKLQYNKGRIVFESHDKNFSGITIRQIIRFVNSVHRKHINKNPTLVFLFDKVSIVDKLSYVIFECICYSLIRYYNHKVYVYWQPEKNILTDGVFLSPLLEISKDYLEKTDGFEQKFLMDIRGRHFRRVINGTDKKQTNYLGKLNQEIDSFLKVFDITKEYRDSISEVVGELVGNACEHADTDCLVDIDVTTDHMKEIKNVPQEGSYYGVNIAILDFSFILLGDGVKKKIVNNSMNYERYEDVKKAYEYHKQYFNEDYLFEDFCNLASLQDKISGREIYHKSGGTGLTKLINSLQEKSDLDACYLISGSRSVLFINEYLNYDNSGWLGFNSKNDFFTEVPGESVVSESVINFPGTAYNLNFVMKREED